MAPALLGAGLLVLLLVLLAGLQYRWLDQLRSEQLRGRQAALQVAGEHFRDQLQAKLSAYHDSVAVTLVAGPAVLADDPLVEAVLELDPTGEPRRWRTAGDTGWRSLTRAKAWQLLNGEVRLTGAPPARSALRVAPASVVACGGEGCWLALLREGSLAQTFLAPGLKALSARLGEPILRTAVARATPDGVIQEIVTPADLAVRDFPVTDLRLPLLTPEPDDGQWWLLVNHAGHSLSDEVTATYLRNLLVSAAILLLLLAGGALVIGVARRQTRLARQQLVFTASVSHELRTPLSVIASAADNLAAGTVSDAGKVASYGELIHDETRRLHAMIENVLQFSRNASYEGPLEALSPAELVDAALSALEPRLRNRELRRDVPHDLPTVEGTRTALCAVLTNLVDNAVRYSEDGDWISIAAGITPVRPRGRALCITVSNPVQAPPDPWPERLFEPFYRGRNALGANVAGTGIGLSVARGIAEQHGGGLAVDTSAPGVIHFRLYLPLSG